MRQHRSLDDLGGVSRTMVVGRSLMFAPTIGLYAGNMLPSAAVALRLLVLTEVEPGDHRRDRQTSLAVRNGRCDRSREVSLAPSAG